MYYDTRLCFTLTSANVKVQVIIYKFNYNAA